MEENWISCGTSQWENASEFAFPLLYSCILVWATEWKTGYLGLSATDCNLKELQTDSPFVGRSDWPKAPLSSLAIEFKANLHSYMVFLPFSSYRKGVTKETKFMLIEACENEGWPLDNNGFFKKRNQMQYVRPICFSLCSRLLRFNQ